MSIVFPERKTVLKIDAAEVAELAYAPDSKSGWGNTQWGFKSPLRHHFVLYGGFGNPQGFVINHLFFLECRRSNEIF